MSAAHHGCYPLGALDTARAYARGDFSAHELIDETLHRIESSDRHVNAFTAVVAERALSDAQRLDTLRATGAALPPLAGVPFAAKNLFDIAGLTTLAGSRVLAGNPPRPRRRNARAAVARARRDHGRRAQHGRVRLRLYDGEPSRRAMPQSARSGAHGGWLVRRQRRRRRRRFRTGHARHRYQRLGARARSLCGVFGVKPTYGRLSRHGTWPFVASIDHMGAFTRNVDDLAAVYDACNTPTRTIRPVPCVRSNR